MVLPIMYHNPDLLPLEINPKGDWVDLRAAETVELKAGEFKIISLGISLKLPVGYEAHVLPRSSTFRKWGIIMACSMGIIDNSYCGQGDVWGFPAIALKDTEIELNDRIAQFRIMPSMMSGGKIAFIENCTEEFSAVSRGGFGSTGKN